MKKEKNNTSKCPICGRPTHKESKYCIFHASAEEKTEEDFKRELKKYINKIKEENEDYYFKKFIFVGHIDFKKDLNVTIFKYTVFEEVTFKGAAVFNRATFEGGAVFNRATFERGAVFNRATFEGDAVFSEATFEGYAFFSDATFEEYANFRGATFERDAYFNRVTFKRYAFFSEATFKGYAFFSEATFKGNASFSKATIKEYADFSEENFEGNDNFSRATFEGNDFSMAIIKGGAVFNRATFKGGAVFSRATFEGDAVFGLKYLDNIIDFSEIKIFSGKKLFIKIINEGGKINFNRAYLESTYLDMELVKDVLIDFTDVLIKNTKIGKDKIENHIIQEKEMRFSEAKEIYLLLKNNFHNVGQYEDESWAYKKEKDMDRLSHSWRFYMKELKKEKKEEKLPFLTWIKNGDFKKWIISAFSNIIYGYGEKPWNVIKTAVAIIIIFALSFSFIGLGNPEIIELKGTAIHQNSGNMVDLVSKGLLKNNVIRNFPDSLYFSTITFTTLGYGDFRPLEGLGRILAGSEAFIGAFMMALFVYTFARRTGGR